MDFSDNDVRIKLSYNPCFSGSSSATEELLHVCEWDYIKLQSLFFWQL